MADAVTLTGRFVRQILAVGEGKLPEAAVEMATHVCIDGLAVMLAGSTEPLGVGERITRYVQRQGGTADASVVAGRFQTTTGLAAFANGTLAHALDYDNTWYPLNHPTSPTLPAILAVAESRDRSGAEVIMAVVAAFEVQARLRMASRGLHTGRGFHKPGMTGTFGAVAAAGLLLGLDETQMAHALGIAGSRAGSLAINTGTMTKSSHAGHAARMGVESAELAEMGFTANADVFGPGGYFPTFLGDEYDAELLVEGFGTPFRIATAGVGFKKYPANYFTHRCIDAALAIRRDPRFRVDAVAAVEVRFPVFAYVDRPHPASGLDGKFSVQYTTALALLDGQITIDTFTDDRRRSRDVHEMLERTHATFDPSISPDFMEMHVVVTVELADGTVLRQRVDELTGMPGVPLTPEQREEKFFVCADRVLAHDQAKELLAALESLPTAHDIHRIMELARTPR